MNIALIENMQDEMLRIIPNSFLRVGYNLMY